MVAIETVSISHRYGSTHEQLVGRLQIPFQSLIGTVQQNMSSTEVKKNLMMFQSLIGTVQLNKYFHEFTPGFKFQSLIGTVQLEVLI